MCKRKARLCGARGSGRLGARSGGEGEHMHSWLGRAADLLSLHLWASVSTTFCVCEYVSVCLLWGIISLASISCRHRTNKILFFEKAWGEKTLYATQTIDSDCLQLTKCSPSEGKKRCIIVSVPAVWCPEFIHPLRVQPTQKTPLSL